MPCSRSRRRVAAQSARSVVIIPPSPVVSTLRGWKLQAASSERCPTGWPPACEPAAQAESSNTRTSRSASSWRIAATSAGMPPWCTTMTARVRSVRTGATVAADRFAVPSSTSANTGVAPTYRTALVVAMKLKEGTTTSSPGPIPATTRPRCSAVVQLEVATAWDAPTDSAKPCSNSADPRSLGDPARQHRGGSRVRLLLTEPGLHHRDARHRSSPLERPASH